MTGKFSAKNLGFTLTASLMLASCGGQNTPQVTPESSTTVSESTSTYPPSPSVTTTTGATGASSSVPSGASGATGSLDEAIAELDEEMKSLDALDDIDKVLTESQSQSEN